MEAEELLKLYEEKIDKPWIENKVKFLTLGSRGEFAAIRRIIRFKEPEPDKIKVFIDICTSRLERLEKFASDLMLFLSIALAIFTFSIQLSFDKFGISTDSIIPSIRCFLKRGQSL